MTNWIEQGQASLSGCPGPNARHHEHDTYIIDCRHTLTHFAPLMKYPPSVFVSLTSYRGNFHLNGLW